MMADAKTNLESLMLCSQHIRSKRATEEEAHEHHNIAIR